MTEKLIEMLAPLIPPPPPFHACEARLLSYSCLTDEYKARRARNLGQEEQERELCGRRSSYRVTGKCYCKVHAGPAALKCLVALEEKRQAALTFP